MFAVQAAISLGFLLWIWYYRNSTVVKFGQPEFLSIVCVGCVLLVSAILALSVQGGYPYERDAITLEETTTPNPDIKRVDEACMAVPWLVFMGFSLIYSALLAKLIRVKILVKDAAALRRGGVKKRRVFTLVGGCFVVMVALLLSWQLVSPLVWDRYEVSFDADSGYPIGEYFGGSTVVRSNTHLL